MYSCYTICMYVYDAAKESLAAAAFNSSFLGTYFFPN